MSVNLLLPASLPKGPSVFLRLRQASALCEGKHSRGGMGQVIPVGLRQLPLFWRGAPSPAPPSAFVCVLDSLGIGTKGW